MTTSILETASPDSPSEIQLHAQAMEVRAVQTHETEAEPCTPAPLSEPMQAANPFSVTREQAAILGQLNPQRVEWLMGWPSGWTDLGQLETGKFQEWLRGWHGEETPGP